MLKGKWDCEYVFPGFHVGHPFSSAWFVICWSQPISQHMVYICVGLELSVYRQTLPIKCKVGVTWTFIWNHTIIHSYN